MTEEPEIKELNGDDDATATKGFVRQENDKMLTILADIKTELEETRRHVDVLAENIHKDVARSHPDSS